MKINGDISEDELEELIRNNRLTPNKFWKAYAKVHGLPKAQSDAMKSESYVKQLTNKFFDRIRKRKTKNKIVSFRPNFFNLDL